MALYDESKFRFFCFSQELIEFKFVVWTHLQIRLSFSEKSNLTVE